MLGEARVDERRAAILMGISPEELRRLAQQTSFGQPGNGDGLVFTYDELRRLALLAARPNH